MPGNIPLLLVAGLLASASYVHADLLTEQRAIALALARTAVVDKEREELLAAESAIAEVGMWPNPIVSVDKDRTRTSTGTDTETTWKISQTLDLSGKRSLLQQGARQRFQAAQSEQRVSRQGLTSQVRQVFAEVLAGELRVNALKAWQDRIAKASVTVARLAQSGEVSGYDRRRLARELQTAKAKRQQSEANLVRLQQQLAGLTHMTSRASLRVTGALLPALPPDLPVLMTSLAERADLTLLEAHSRALASESRAAGRGWAPDVTVGVGQKLVETSAGSEKSLVLSLAVPLPLFDRGSPMASRLAAQSRAMKAEQALRLSTAESDMTGNWEQLQHLHAAAVSFRRDALQESQALSGIAERAYRAGETGVLELLDAYRSELEAEMTALDLEFKTRLIRIELDLLAGAAS